MLRFLSRGQVPNESRIARATSMCVLPCCGCPSPACVLTAVYRIRRLRRAQTQLVCHPSCAIVLAPWPRCCAFLNSEDLPGQCEIYTKQHLDERNAERCPKENQLQCPAER